MKKVFLLLHGVVPVGICVFSSPAASLSLRSRAFGLSRARSRVAMSALNQQLWLLQRVVIHPSYRGAGIASAFIRECCERCPVRWIETLSAMGQIHPFFERAGFRRIGMIRKPLQASPKRNLSHGAYSGKIQLSQETLRKSRFSEPVYYLWENQDRTDRARVS